MGTLGVKLSTNVGTIYFVRPVGMSSPTKIGWSKNPSVRLRSLQTWSPFRLEVAARCDGTIATEKALHLHFADHRTHGEWFDESKDLLRLVDELSKGKELADCIDVGAISCLRPPKVSRNLSADRRMWLSHVHKLRWAAQKASSLRNDGRMHPPERVDAIMARWNAGQAPSSFEFSLLQEAIAHPALHFISFEERYPSRSVRRVA